MRIDGINLSHIKKTQSKYQLENHQTTMMCNYDFFPNYYLSRALYNFFFLHSLSIDNKGKQRREKLSTIKSTLITAITIMTSNCYIEN